MRIIFCLILVYFFTTSLWGQQTSFISDDTVYNTIQQLKEVVVTAEKRELSPTNIPAALSVVTSKLLPQENNLDLRNISGIVPNFYMQEGGLKLSTPIYIRGIGTVSGTPPVGLYVDGVPVFDKNAFVFDLYDIRQIEVLRGPQTTLYGRNSINGLINIVTNTPSPKWEFQGRAGYASYNTQTYQAIVNAPVKDIIYNKFSFAYNKSDGYFRNKFENNRLSNPSESYNFRYMGNIYLKHGIKISLGLNYNNSYDGGYAYHSIDSLKKDRYKVNYNTPSSYDRDLLSTYFNLKKNFRKVIFNWTTSYSWSKDKQVLDADFTYKDVFDNIKKSHQNMVTQEINLLSAQSKSFDWTGGVFGFYKDLDNNYLATFGKDKKYLLPMDLDKVKYFNNMKTFGVAGYGQVTVKELLPGLFITAGLRYDYERTDLNYRDSLLFSGTRKYLEYHRSDEYKNFNAWLPKFSVLQKWNDRLSLYLNIAKGYKAGGYNIIANEMSSMLVNLNYGKENLWNYEVGMKYFSASKKFNLNTAFFYIDWKDQQIFVMGMMGPCIKNAGDARSIGGEMDLRWEFLPNLTYTLSAGYSHSTYYHHLTKAYEGNRVVMAPDFTVNTGLLYQKPVNLSWCQAFTASTSVIGFGTQYFDEANLLKQKPYFQWNLNFSITGKYFDLHVWGKNILDKHFFTYMLNNPVGMKLPEYYNMGQSGSPARFGISLDFKI